MNLSALVIISGVIGIVMLGCGGGSSTMTTRAQHAAPAPQPGSPAGLNAAKTQRFLNFGHIAGETDARQVSELTEKYYGAVGHNDGATACALIYRSMANAVPEDVAPQTGHRSCSKALSQYFRNRGGKPTPDVSTIRVTQVRTNGEVAIALLKAPAMKSGELTLRRENGTWKVLDFLGSVLPFPTLAK